MNMWNNVNTPVYFKKCDNYDFDKVNSALIELFSYLPKDLFKNKKVLIKPNLLMKADIGKCITTNPVIVEASAKLLYQYGAESVIIAESPGGPYTVPLLRQTYNASGIKNAAERSGAELNYNIDYTSIYDEENRIIKVMNVLDPILNADIVLSISKLKSHALTTMSGAVKNLFGIIPGIQKFETHARFPDHTDFANAIIDICSTLHRKKNVINITDAVTGLEGNGPSTSGIPRDIGYLAMSQNPFNLDLFNAHMISFDDKVEIIKLAQDRGYTNNVYSDLEIVGDDYGKTVVSDFRLPDTKTLNIFKHIPKFLSPRPKIDTKICRGCGECKKSCPAHTISIVNNKAVIDSSRCIKCFCCQELCPFHSVKIHEDLIYKIIRSVEKLL